MEEPGLDPDLLDELFPVRSTSRRTRKHVKPPPPDAGVPRRGRRLDPSPSDPGPPTTHPARRPLVEPGADEGGRSLRTRRPLVLAASCAVVALALRLVLVRVVPANDVVHLHPAGLGLGAVLVAVVVWLCARLGATAPVCLALACAVASADLVAPVGIAVVLLVALGTRRR